MERLWMLALMAPDAFRLGGRLLMSVGLAWAGFGWHLSRGLGRVSKRVAGTGADAPTTLAQAYPGLPTWWIPETTAGFVCIAMLFLLGATMAHLGKTAAKLAR